MNNKYISPLVDNVPFMGNIKTGLGVATAFGFKRKRVIKNKKNKMRKY